MKHLRGSVVNIINSHYLNFYINNPLLSSVMPGSSVALMVHGKKIKTQKMREVNHCMYLENCLENKSFVPLLKGSYQANLQISDP